MLEKLNYATQPSRRAFLKGMTVTAGGALLAACATSGSPATGAGETMADDSPMEEAVVLRFLA